MASATSTSTSVNPAAPTAAPRSPLVFPSPGTTRTSPIGDAGDRVALCAQGHVDGESKRRAVGGELQAHGALRPHVFDAQAGDRHALRQGSRAQQFAVANFGPAGIVAEAPEAVARFVGGPGDGFSGEPRFRGGEIQELRQPLGFERSRARSSGRVMVLTSPTNRPMIISTTSISMSVKPRLGPEMITLLHRLPA